METWIIYALLSGVLAGLYSFCLKVVAERGYNTYRVTFYDYLIGSVLSGIYLINYLSSTSVNLQDIGITILLATVNVIFFSLSILSRVEAMKNIDSVIFFPLYKTFGPIMVTCVSLFLFQEVLTGKEFFGIVCGILVPLMLITKTENRIQKNLYLGLILVLITSILTVISAMGIKELMNRELSVEIFVFSSFALGTVLSYIGEKAHLKRTKKQYESKGVLSFSAVVSLIHLSSFIVFVLALSGNLAIVYTINSFSILIPIILSIMFYGEHFNMKKGIVIGLSIISILLFI